MIDRDTRQILARLLPILRDPESVPEYRRERLAAEVDALLECGAHRWAVASILASEIHCERCGAAVPFDAVENAADYPGIDNLSAALHNWREGVGWNRNGDQIPRAPRTALEPYPA